MHTNPTPQTRYRRLLAYARPYAGQWLLVALAGVCSSMVMMAQPWPMQVLVDHVLNSNPMPAWLAQLTQILPSASTRGGLIAWIAIATLVFYTLGNLFDAIVS